MFLIFIYWAPPGLSYSCTESSIFAVTCRIKFPEQGLNPGLLHWEHGVLAPGPPGLSVFHVEARWQEHGGSQYYSVYFLYFEIFP